MTEDAMATETVPMLELTPADVVDLADALRPYYYNENCQNHVLMRV
jgi:hypothetical protein